MKTKVTIILTVLIILFGLASAAKAEGSKLWVCHATSSATNPYNLIHISENAVYGPGGHFNENGTTQAGHEQDLGPFVNKPSQDVCPTYVHQTTTSTTQPEETSSTTSTSTPTTTSTVVQSSTSTTTESSSSTSTTPTQSSSTLPDTSTSSSEPTQSSSTTTTESPTTTVTSSSSTTVSAPATTTSSVPGEVSTTFPDSSETSEPEVGITTDPPDSINPAPRSVPSGDLPTTGANSYWLLALGAICCLIGVSLLAGKAIRSEVRDVTRGVRKK